MNRTEVTRDGLREVRPGREAVTGSIEHDGTRRRRRGGEEPMVPEATFDSYYGKPIINQPVWEAPDIPGYLFLGGLAGASALLGVGAQATGRDGLRRVCAIGSGGAAAVSAVALIHDLGRPERFFNMLRVFKPTSPMSVGSWILAGFGTASGVAAASEITGRLPRLGRLALLASAPLAAPLAAYTAALISDTAVPSWHEGYREMPFVFVASAATAAGGLGLLGAPVAENGPAVRLAVLGGVGELVASKLMEQRIGMASEPYHEGRADRYMKLGEALTGLGAAASSRPPDCSYTVEPRSDAPAPGLLSDGSSVPPGAVGDGERRVDQRQVAQPEREVAQ